LESEWAGSTLEMKVEIGRVQSVRGIVFVYIPNIRHGRGLDTCFQIHCILTSALTVRVKMVREWGEVKQPTETL
jgi:hypothetical protein